MLSRVGVAVGGLLFGVAMIAGVEFLLVLLGVGEDAPPHDPFAGFSAAVPTFVPATSESGEAIYQLAPARRRPARIPAHEPQREFLAVKPPDEFRIFAIGGSSTEGVPYSTNYAFPWWLERRLQAALPDRRVEVVNAGMSGYASARIVPIVEEIAAHSPDLLVVYMGHNEWAESMYYSHLLKIPPPLFRVLEWVYSTRMYTLASQILQMEAFQQKPELDLDANQNNLQMFGVLRGRAKGEGLPTPRELAYRDLLYEHSLRKIADAMARVGARVAFLTLGQNFSDWSPPASGHREGLGDEDLERWEREVAHGRDLAGRGRCGEAVAAFQRALAIDDQYAELHFLQAECLQKLDRISQAREHFRLASDLDRVPQGASTKLNEILRRVAADSGGLFVDTLEALYAASGPNLVGDDLFTDFAHPNVRAHQLIAESLATAMQEVGVVAPFDAWQAGYQEIPLEEIYRDNPLLPVVELKSRVFVCILAMRPSCGAEAERLLAYIPDDPIAVRVLAEYALAQQAESQ